MFGTKVVLATCKIKKEASRLTGFFLIYECFHIRYISELFFVIF